MKQYELPVTQPVFRLKGGSLAATVLELGAIAPAALAAQLAQKVAQAPQLLRHSPLIIDLDKLDDADGPLDLAALLATCRQHDLQPVALRAHRACDLAQARQLGLAILPQARARERLLDDLPRNGHDDVGGASRLPASNVVPPAGDAPEGRHGTGPQSGDACLAGTGAVTPAAPSPDISAPPAVEAALTLGPAARPARVIHQPVRGGQQVYAEGDLILLAPVSAGAEVIADGNIHCYAPLRGRALAGVQGDAGARLFCRELNAELVAIAGHYRTADDLKADALWGKAAQLFLRDGQLSLAAL